MIRMHIDRTAKNRRLASQSALLERHNLAPSDSSPRVRGTLRQAARPFEPQRFIPACAGNTESASAAPYSAAVHPRVCGEHHCGSPCNCRSGGSSPRVRGTLGRAPLTTPPARFIPACAGNTERHRFDRYAETVHPRVCGEHLPQAPKDIIAHGSSPRVRGTLAPPPRRPFGGRFIPACAGNTTLKNVARSASSVHPRVCGEHVLTAACAFEIGGSSPRVRGTQSTFLAVCLF